VFKDQKGTNYTPMSISHAPNKIWQQNCLFAFATNQERSYSKKSLSVILIPHNNSRKDTTTRNRS